MLRCSKSWIKPALFAGALSLGASGAAFAATGATTTGTAAPANAEQAEMAAVQAAPVTPVAAIKAAEAKSGGHAVDFGYEKTSTLQIDPTSGAVTSTTSVPADALASAGLPTAADVSKAAAAQISLDAAVTSAEKASGGRALEANYTMRQGKLMVDVGVVKNGSLVTYDVDASIGAVNRAAQLRKSANAG